MPEAPPHLDRRRIRWRGFADAGRGVILLVRTQPNARIHLAATFGAIALATWLGLSGAEWAGIIVAIALVWVTEAVNTALEFTVDLACPERRDLAGWAKDVAAGAVLLAALAAVAIGLAVFGPKLLAHWRLLAA